MLMAEWKPTPHTFGRMKPTLIVVHETGTRITKGSAVKYCTAPKSTNPIRVGYHIIIERDGTIVQLARFNQKVRHAGRSKWKGRSGSCNHYSIGIGLVGPTELKGTVNRAKAYWKVKTRGGIWANRVFTADDGLSDASSKFHGKGHIWLKHTTEQLVSLDEVVAELRQAYPGIDIAGHYQVSPGRKIDPSPLVDIAAIGVPPAPIKAPPIDEPVDSNPTPAQELSHAKQQVEGDNDDYAVSPCEPTDKILRKTSREYKTTNVIKGVAATPVVGAGLMEMASASKIASLKSYLDIVTGFIAAYGLPLLVGGCVAVWAGAELVQYYKRQSYDNGLYAPSGEDDA